MWTIITEMESSVRSRQVVPLVKYVQQNTSGICNIEINITLKYFLKTLNYDFIRHWKVCVHPVNCSRRLAEPEPSSNFQAVTVDVKRKGTPLPPPIYCFSLVTAVADPGFANGGPRSDAIGARIEVPRGCPSPQWGPQSGEYPSPEFFWLYLKMRILCAVRPIVHANTPLLGLVNLQLHAQCTQTAKVGKTRLLETMGDYTVSR